MLKKIRTYNNISVQGLDRFSRDAYEVGSEFAAPDAFMLRSHNLHNEPFPESLKAIARCGAGVNNIPVDHCTEQGIVVFNTPGANANAVKELVISAMLLSSRGILGGVNFVKSEGPQADPAQFSALVEKAKKQFSGTELAGKTLGVIGLGAIGAAVAHAALALDMQVIGFDPKLSVEAAWRLSSDVEKAANLATLLARSDFVTLHVPANEHTANLMGPVNIAHMKPGAVLLNFARGSIVNSDAVKAALQQQQLRGYVSDFPQTDLLAEENCIQMPHLGASTVEAEDNCAEMAAKQLIDFLEHGNIRNSVNFPEIRLERTEGYRITFANDNVPKVLSHVLALLSDMNINVIDMLNKSRGSVAYTIVDIEDEPTEELLTAIASVEHVFHVSTF